jgi:hypothetical protein
MNKSRTIAEIQKDIEHEKALLIELQNQNEDGWEEIKIWLSGKKSNIPLVKAHISYYTKELAEINKNGINRWFK